MSTRQPILLSVLASSLLLSAAMAGETGPSSVAPAGGVHAAGLPPAVAADKAGPWEPVQTDLKAEAAAQYKTLVVQIANRAWFERDHVASQAAHPQGLILKDDRDPLDVLLRRTKALLGDVKARGPRYDLSEAEVALNAAEAKAHNLPAETIARVTPAEAGSTHPGRAVWANVKPPPPAGGRYELFLEVCTIRRQIALANPLIDFEQILFIKRANPCQGHMCGYPGGSGGQGGGVFVLDRALGSEPRIRNVLSATADVKAAGRNPSSLTVCSADLSFDGRRIAFAAYAPASKPAAGRASGWSLFQVNADGSGLVRLTDGSSNDFDPCYLPDGGVVFISERRGGFGRCHPCAFPTYTLHRVNADGSDLTCLSYHETNEWNPSVAHDGKIVFTRWDYVDRDTNTAHHMWTCFPDGRDPRSMHGNYPPNRQGKSKVAGPGETRFGHRPWGEWGCRAVPGRSGLFVATAGAHHGSPTFGSLVLIDQTVEDDGQASQFRRITPEAPFPEAEGDVPRNREFGYAWPLSDRYFLCAYDAEGSGHDHRSFRYGLYLVDSFGNRELFYCDPAVSSISPIPLRARPMPPSVAPQLGPATRPATIAIMNVYASDFAWPADARITALRIMQVLPKSTPFSDRPRIGAAKGASARAVLGTVPVERDGSAYFEAPAGKSIYFQALDDRGMAVQSMRSVTYLQPGEQMTCLGCHEPKRTTRPPGESPLALRRAPSSIRPDVEGSNPFSYVRLVQPVLDRHCVACHAEKKAIDLSGGILQPNADPKKRDGSLFTRSYANLTPKYAFWYDSYIGCFTGPRGGARTIAGKFGAMASPLLALLDKGHHGVKLPPEDLHRLTLWMDCNSDFLGAYHSVEAQLRGEIVKPDLE